jgi:hypothetical protein
MLRSIIFLLVVVTFLFSYEDSDFDGVSDYNDRCPNTPITDIIDQFGCSLVKIMSDDPVSSRYDVIVGLIYDKADYGSAQEYNTLTNTFQADYFLENWSFQFYTSYYFLDNPSSTRGMNDTALSLYYGLKPMAEENLFLRFGLGTNLPTQKNDYNKIDYTASLSANYIIDKYSFFCGYKYMLTGDNDSDILDFQNTISLNAGFGYYVQGNVYTSISILDADSIVRSLDAIRNISFYMYYGIDDNWFMTASYAKGLSDATSDLSSNVRIGYAF